MNQPPIRLDPLSRGCLLILAVVAGFTALKVAEDIFAPLALALVAGVILAPLADRLERLKLPRALVAATLPAIGIVALGALAFALEPLVGRIVDQWPTIKWELRGFVNDFRSVFQNIGAVNDEVERALGGQGGGTAADNSAPVVPSLTDAMFVAPRVGAQTLIFLAALFFFLLTRGGIYAWLARQVGRSVGADVALDRIEMAEHLVSRYFLTITLINLGLGAAVALGMALVGMPSPVTWGFGAMLLNFVLYIGPATMVVALLLGGLIVFDGPSTLLPAAIYIGLNFIESQFVTPTFVGKHIAVNPLLIFVSLVFWLWFWGPLGGLIAIPVLVTVLAMLDAFDQNPAEELSGRPAPDPQPRRSANETAL